MNLRTLTLLGSTMVAAAALTAPSIFAAQQAMPSPAPAKPVPHAIWEKTLKSATSEYEYKDAAAAGDMLWLVVGVRPKGELGGAQTNELWRVDAHGERINTTNLSALGAPDKPDDKYATFFALTALPNGQAALLFKAVRGLGYVVIDVTGRVVSNQAVLPAAVDPFITHMKMSDGNVLAVGRLGTEGWILKLRPTGQVVDDRKVPAVAILQDAVEGPDGYVAVGGSLRPAPEVWIGKVGVKGDVGAGSTFAGVNPAFTPDSRGGFVLVYAVNAQKGRNVVVQGMTPALAVAWTVKLPELVQGMRPYAVEAIGDSEFLLAGDGPGNVPLIRRLKRDGTVVWRHEHREGGTLSTQAGTVGVTRWNADRLVALTLTVVEPIGETFEQRQVIKLIKFGAQ